MVFCLSADDTLCVKHQFSSLFLLSKLLLSVLKMASVGLKAGIIKSYQGINLFLSRNKSVLKKNTEIL